MEKYIVYGFGELDHGKKRKCPLFTSPAIIAKFPLRWCSFCARKTAYCTKQFSFSTLGKKLVTLRLQGDQFIHPKSGSLRDVGCKVCFVGKVGTGHFLC